MGGKGRQDPRKDGHTIQQGETRRGTASKRENQEGVQSQTRGDKTLGEVDTPSSKGKQKRVQWGDKGGQDPGEGGHTIQQRETRRGDKGRQDPGEGGQAIQHQDGHFKKALRTRNSTLLEEQEGSQGETRGDKTRDGGHTIQQRETRTGTRGEKGRQKGRQDPREGGHTVQQRETKRETRGDKGRQGETKGEKGRQKGRQKGETKGETRVDKTLGKADTPSDKGKQEGRQGEARGETRPSGRRARHPTPRRTT